MNIHGFCRDGDGAYPRLVLKTTEEWGIVTADLCRPPQRLLALEHHADAPVELGLDSNRLSGEQTPAKVLEGIPGDASVSAIGRRSIARLLAYFLVCEDPQRRLDAREVSTLAHQVSLVRHILDNQSLRRVLIADEVGLGKTVEAGLLIKELLEQRPSARVLYFAPARLVSNVRREFDRLGLGFRQWSAQDADARLDDPRLIVSIHRAVHPSHRESILNTQAWDILVVDECHHLSDWAEGGGDPREKFRLVRDLIRKQSPQGRVVLLSGTPHQGHKSRFENLVGLLRGPDETLDAINRRVIFRTKDHIVDWDGNYLFPRRSVNPPLVLDLGARYRDWISAIHNYYSPPRYGGDLEPTAKQRAAGWRCAQAMQWAASSPHAGLGYLARQALRLGATLEDPPLAETLIALRPYRGGPENESIMSLYDRVSGEIRRQESDNDLEDIEVEVELEDRESLVALFELMATGLDIIRDEPDLKWRFIEENVIHQSGGEKIVFFAQPIETVSAFVHYLRQSTGADVSVIIGGQSDEQRKTEVDKFCRPDGSQFLVSSRAGGEGINLQVARRLVHIDVPWNPMDMEQRVGRVHRFGSRKNIIVDTVVVRNSREEHAYRAARDKLRIVATTMVDQTDFESLFSRVICLVPPEELQHLLIDGDSGPLSLDNEQQLAHMVQQGFEKWREFDTRYAEQQRRIRTQDAGLADWGHVRGFMSAYGRAVAVEGFCTERFAVSESESHSVRNASPVLRLSDGSLVACEDLGGLPSYGPDDQVASQFGLNQPQAMELLRRFAFENEGVGPAFLKLGRPLKWNENGASLVIFAFLRMTYRADENRGWVEHAAKLRFFVADGQMQPRELNDDDVRELVNELFKVTVRSKKSEIPVAVERLVLNQATRGGVLA